ncbi:ABC transporter permease [Neptunomonas qingdaonensis]|uniref:Capsular polysaccharide transport system permease protein n=1 Tax=Neptunomonas qingdaonensis TaxID=1045558 RepID=A0A1I2PT10_9GAMM|nr:ABC transporter permease [Neptunomonas qingdaonensis]SFG19405.1 capsular polysaccharide transport system permease protein [Neptunomonas qingdaonensis]
MLSNRSPWQVTTSVWYALFMREALARTTADRFAWFWMIAEPVGYIIIMISIRTVLLNKTKTIFGAEFVPWMIVGLFGFFLFRENMMRSIGAIDANKGLFAYRQVKPIDPVLVRCYLEGILKTFIFSLFIFTGLLVDLDLLPRDALKAIFYWVLLWCLGLGIGLVLSAVSALVPEVGRIVRMISMPLMLVSGVILPLNFLSYKAQSYMLWNPIVHGIELLRTSFFPLYQSIHGVSIAYLCLWILGSMSLGLLLHLRYAQKLKAQ